MTYLVIDAKNIDKNSTKKTVSSKKRSYFFLFYKLPPIFTKKNPTVSQNPKIFLLIDDKDNVEISTLNILAIGRLLWETLYVDLFQSVTVTVKKLILGS